MLIYCQNCANSYQINPSSLGPSGRSVRCARCQRKWFATNPMALANIAHAYRADLVAFLGPNAIAPPVARPGTKKIFIESPSTAPSIDTSSISESTAILDAPRGERPDMAPLSPGTPDDEFLPQSQHPVAIVASPSLAPMEQGEITTPVAASRVGQDIEIVALRRAKQGAARARSRWSLAAWPTAVLVLIAINAALIGRRADVVRSAPQTASLYAAIGLPVNLRGLIFANVTTQKEIQNGVQVLVVEGTIASAASRATEVPRLRFGVRNEAGHEIYTWTALPNRNVLAANETLAFRSRLASPPREAHDVLVRFFDPRDLVADLQ